jgi:magnesium-transporting ATPase (P-type)
VAFAGIATLGTFAVKSASEMQDLRQSFDTMLGSAEKGRKLFIDIQKMANVTPFTSTDLASATSTMLGF